MSLDTADLRRNSRRRRNRKCHCSNLPSVIFITIFLLSLRQQISVKRSYFLGSRRSLSAKSINAILYTYARVSLCLNVHYDDLFSVLNIACSFFRVLFPFWAKVSRHWNEHRLAAQANIKILNLKCYNFGKVLCNYVDRDGIYYEINLHKGVPFEGVLDNGAAFTDGIFVVISTLVFLQMRFRFVNWRTVGIRYCR